MFLGELVNPDDLVANIEAGVIIDLFREATRILPLPGGNEEEEAAFHDDLDIDNSLLQSCRLEIMWIWFSHQEGFVDLLGDDFPENFVEEAKKGSHNAMLALDRAWNP